MVILVLIKQLMTIILFFKRQRELIILLIIIFPQVRYNNYDKNIIIIGDSMLNNINNRGLCKSKKVSVSNFPGATSEDILAEAEDTLKLHPDNLIVHARNKWPYEKHQYAEKFQKVMRKSKKNLARYKDCVFEYNLPEGQTNTNRQRSDTNARLKNVCNQKNISLIDSGNIKEEHLGVKKWHLNRQSNSLFAKNLLSFIEIVNVKEIKYIFGRRF